MYLPKIGDKVTEVAVGATKGSSAFIEFENGVRVQVFRNPTDEPPIANETVFGESVRNSEVYKFIMDYCKNKSNSKILGLYEELVVSFYTDFMYPKDYCGSMFLERFEKRFGDYSFGDYNMEVCFSVLKWFAEKQFNE